MKPITCENPECPDAGRCDNACAREAFPMTVEEAQELLNLCEREELRDHAFGDREVFWTFDGVEVASGYFGSSGKRVWIYRYFPGIDFADQCEVIASFRDAEAHVLATCGKITMIERNDMQGDDIPDYRGA